MLFAGVHYYPYGGMGDLLRWIKATYNVIGRYNSLDEAIARARLGTDPDRKYSLDYDWYHVYDLHTQDLVVDFTGDL